MVTEYVITEATRKLENAKYLYDEALKDVERAERGIKLAECQIGIAENEGKPTTWWEDELEHKQGELERYKEIANDRKMECDKCRADLKSKIAERETQYAALLEEL